MQDNLLEKLLSEKYISRDTGLPIIVPIKKILIEQDIAANADSLISSINIGDNPILVSDKNTYGALAKKIENITGINSIILEGNVKPDKNFIELLHQKTKAYDSIIAVGSGTINDLCKFVSFKDKKPYMVWGTAASMNGYASANASIISDGYKKSFSAHLPQAIFLDLDVLATAPVRLTKSGFGDSICRPTAQADWLLSHLLLNTKYLEEPFLLLKSSEEQLLKNAKKLPERDKKTIELLAKTLIISGIGMYISEGSYPASQGEHLIAHYMDMLHPNNSFHGEQIAVTTLEMAALQERIVSLDKIEISNNYPDKAYLISHFGKKTGEYCASQLEEKACLIENLNKKSPNWLNIKKKIQRITLPGKKVFSALKAAQAPLEPADIGWNIQNFADACQNAAFLRNRFTFLDMKKIIKF